MWSRWLVDRPVVEWWIPHWVLSIKLNISGILLSKIELIWTNSNLNQTKVALAIVFSLMMDSGLTVIGEPEIYESFKESCFSI